MEYVVFTETNARILKNPKSLENIKEHYIILKDPDKSKVSGFPLEYWKADVENNVVLPMNDNEIELRVINLALKGAMNNIYKEMAKPPKIEKPKVLAKKSIPVIPKKPKPWWKFWGKK